MATLLFQPSSQVTSAAVAQQLVWSPPLSLQNSGPPSAALHSSKRGKAQEQTQTSSQWYGLPMAVLASAGVYCSSRQQRDRSRLRLSRRRATAVKDDFRYTAFRGSGYANWVSDQVLLGRWPYVEPSRVRKEEAGRARLAEILKAGVNVFVSLVGELPPQREHGTRKIDGFIGYANVVAELATGRDPQFPMPPRKVNFMHFPITDRGVPSMSQLKEIVYRLEKEVKAGKKLYIHCWGGRGRAGLVGACLIGKVEGLTADEALDRIQLQYSAREQDGLLSPETESQLKIVRQFFAEM